jgi:hypothetical protein
VRASRERRRRQGLDARDPEHAVLNLDLAAADAKPAFADLAQRTA